MTCGNLEQPIQLGTDPKRTTQLPSTHWGASVPAVDRFLSWLGTARSQSLAPFLYKHASVSPMSEGLDEKYLATTGKLLLSPVHLIV